MKDWLRGFSLALTSFCLGCSSGLVGLGIVASLAFIIITILNKYIRTDAMKRPIFHKWLAYIGVIPCAIWWIITPTVDYGVSPYLVYIPGWYLLYLAFLQWRSILHGGFYTFVVFDGVASLLASTYQAPREILFVALFALILCVISFVRCGVPIYKFILFGFLFAILSGSSVIGYKYWKNHRYSYRGKVAQDYHLKNKMMGFDPVVSLGSFRSNYESRYNDEVVLRIWDTLAPHYIKAAVYEKYVAGIWKLPSDGFKNLYPSRYQVDYGVFEIEDSLASVSKLDSGLKRVWVQSSLENFGFLFTTNGTVGVAVKNDDSLKYYYSGIFKGTEKHHSDWYYFVSSEGSQHNMNHIIENVKNRDLLISEKYNIFLDTIINQMGLVLDSLHDEESLLHQINNYFVFNFKYSLVVPQIYSKLGTSKEDPLFAFWRSKQGYCEYYATLSTLLLRKMGVRARYVTGFYRGERLYNRPYVVFRRNHAHAWVETFIGNQWIPFDPTPPTMMFIGTEPSFFERKVESIRGKWFHFMHSLKEGEWRNTVDSWQNTTSFFVRSPYLYVFFIGIVFLIFVRRFIRNRRKKVMFDSEIHANHVAYWSKILERAERKLLHKGYVRHQGETVHSFVQRIQKNELPDKVKILVNKLKDYESHRWK